MPFIEQPSEKQTSEADTPDQKAEAEHRRDASREKLQRPSWRRDDSQVPLGTPKVNSITAPRKRRRRKPRDLEGSFKEMSIKEAATPLADTRESVGAVSSGQETSDQATASSTNPQQDTETRSGKRAFSVAAPAFVPRSKSIDWGESVAGPGPTYDGASQSP